MVRTPLDAAVKEGRLIELAPLLSDGGVERWWIPKFIADAHPKITTVQEALKHPDLFPAPEDPSRGAIMNCPSGWNCEIVTSNLYKALGAKQKGFDLVETGSAAGLDGSIANAFEKKTGWAGYYWAPTTWENTIWCSLISARPTIRRNGIDARRSPIALIGR
ncbi:substrate binding protein of glycine betaine ABC transport system [Rhizobium sp. ERR 922]|nr:substrate binding protein of glycine betaine ABC transport system [Rhizobium sp. ERR 922]TWB91012.1 substrate binding protein of glycine betaine ABC transport system [Rhizobium sp. ERR 942]